MYKVKGSATNGIQSVQRNCSDDARYELKEAANGKFFFNLKAANHQIIGTSLMSVSYTHLDVYKRQLLNLLRGREELLLVLR